MLRWPALMAMTADVRDERDERDSQDERDSRDARWGAGAWGICGGAQMIRPSGGGPVRVSAVIMSAGCLSVGHDVLYELELGGVVSCLVELNQLVKFSVHYCSCVSLL